MKHFLTATLLALSIYTFGQNKDRRAELDISGGLSEISVSPDEKIWLVTTSGNTYYTNNIDSNWHNGKPLVEQDEFKIHSHHFERASFFNKDTGIITGYIRFDNTKSIEDGYYFTKNGGNRWELRSFGGDSWIYDIHVDKDGNAWMGGLSQELYYSNNFGLNWRTIILPYKQSDRTYSIYMLDRENGISGSDENEILITFDNWITANYLPTPLDQKKYVKVDNNGYSDERISKVRIWKDQYILVNQDGHFFYSELDSVVWKPFPIKIINFEVDPESEILWVISDSLNIVSFSSPNEYRKVSDLKLERWPTDIKIQNGSLYALSHGEVYKINNGAFIHTIPYTTDTKIAPPRDIRKANALTWGINGSQIFISEGDKQDWYRENVLPFNISNLKLLNDSVAILWNGSENYIYSLTNHILKKYYPESPIGDFIKSPIKSLMIESGSQGCFHSMNNEVLYKTLNDSILTTSNLSVRQFRNKKKSTYRHKIKSNSLKNILASINGAPGITPTIKEFKITEEDKKNYLTLVDHQITNPSVYRNRKIERKFYYAILDALDTLDTKTIISVLKHNDGYWSTTSNWFFVQIINQNNDTLNISRSHYVNPFPWNLPWEFEFKGLNFDCYNIEFSQFINSCIPEKFNDKDVFDNSLLIMDIADYFYSKKYE